MVWNKILFYQSKWWTFLQSVSGIHAILNTQYLIPFFIQKKIGDKEERESFRSKGIPVIFQDELDEKPEIGNKSPIILKDEKPPLLPPSYNSANDGKIEIKTILIAY